MEKLYQKLARTIEARLNCEVSGNEIWFNNHTDTIERIEKNNLPSGSGIDDGCVIDFGKSNGNKIVINSSYHVMNDKWINFHVNVTPSLSHDFDLNIIGNFSSNKSAFGIKDYLYDTFHYVLTETV